MLQSQGFYGIYGVYYIVLQSDNQQIFIWEIMLTSCLELDKKLLGRTQ